MSEPLPFEMDLEKSSITLTFGDQAESHVGMEVLGKLVDAGMGFNLDDLQAIKLRFEAIGVSSVIHHIGEDAYLLVISKAIDAMLRNEDDTDSVSPNHIDFFNEQAALNVDKHALIHGKVVSKTARWNLCFDEKAQEPNYGEGKGRVLAYNDAPLLGLVLSKFEKMFGPKAKDLKGEGNYYYDISRCGITWHGDEERRKVIALRLGAPNPIYYHWYEDGRPIKEKMKFEVDGGDIYIMSEKATGNDFKRKDIPTLRHAVGGPRFSTMRTKTKEQMGEVETTEEN